MVQLLRREDVRRPTLLVDAEEAGTGRRRSCIGPKDSDQRTPGRGPIRCGHDLMPIFAEEPREFVSKRRVVVRDEDFHSAPARGNSTVKADPTPGSEVTSIVPPWPVTTCFERTRPSPVS